VAYPRATSSLLDILVEQSLSIDNLFVFILLFDYFRVPLELQNRVLSWGIAGVIALRGLMIGVGVAAIHKYKGEILLFAAILLASSFKLLTETKGGEEGIGESNFVMKLTTVLFPNTSLEFHGESFFITTETGQRMATPLFLCLVCVELSDFVFAVDSIPAVLGVSKDPLVVYASNIFAIMALRSLYTVIAKAVTELHYLKPAVVLVLGFIGRKMISEYFHVEIGTGASLGVVCSLLRSGVLASIWENN
jgi:TerC family integral membrane protein